MNDVVNISGYRYKSAGQSLAHGYLLPTVMKELARLKDEKHDAKIFDLGCGNGSVAAVLSDRGWQVTGVDPSEEGIDHARRAYPGLRLEIGSAYDDLATKYGRFPVVLSLEVVEHVYAPRHYAKTLFDLVEPGGSVILSTPYHGYWKNLALSITGKMDQHFTALWDNGHIKFWSIPTLTLLLKEVGFNEVRFHRVGRIPQLAKSMIVIAQKPA